MSKKQLEDLEQAKVTLQSQLDSKLKEFEEYKTKSELEYKEKSEK